MWQRPTGRDGSEPIAGNAGAERGQRQARRECYRPIPNFALMKEIPVWLQHLCPFVNWLDFRYLGTGELAPEVGRLVGLDSYFALIAPGMFSAYGTFLLRQFLLGILTLGITLASP